MQSNILIKLTILYIIISSINSHRSNNHHKYNDDDNDDDPFNLYRPNIIEEQEISKESIQADIKWYSDLMKIHLDKIEKSNMKNEFEFEIELNSEIIHLMKEFIIDSNEKLSNEINNYFENNLKIYQENTEDLFSYQSSQQWYENKILIISIIIICLIISSFVLTKRNIIILILSLCMIHKGMEMYHDTEIYKSYGNHDQMIPKHCINKDNSLLDDIKGILGFQSTKECMEYHKKLHLKSHLSLNLFKIFSGLFSDLFVGLSSGLGESVSVIYKGLCKYLPWYLSSLILLVLIIVPVIGLAIVIIRIFPHWLMKQNGNINENVITNEIIEILNETNLEKPCKRKKILYSLRKCRGFPKHSKSQKSLKYV